MSLPKINLTSRPAADPKYGGGHYTCQKKNYLANGMGGGDVPDLHTPSSTSPDPLLDPLLGKVVNDFVIHCF